MWTCWYIVLLVCGVFDFLTTLRIRACTKLSIKQRINKTHMLVLLCEVIFASQPRNLNRGKKGPEIAEEKDVHKTFNHIRVLFFYSKYHIKISNDYQWIFTYQYFANVRNAHYSWFIFLSVTYQSGKKNLSNRLWVEVAQQNYSIRYWLRFL